MLANSKIMAFAATTQPAEAREFYETKLGLRFVSDDQFALVFDCDGTMLRVQKVEKLAPAPFTILGWQVADIEAAMDDLEAKGVVFERFAFVENERGIWTAPGGTRVAWFKDPDGSILSLTQFAG